jgi:hypothetical protein
MNAPLNKGAEVESPTPADAGENKPPETGENGRAKNGTFIKGCKPGPGRRRKTPPLETPADLVNRARQLRDEADAWRAIIEQHDTEICRELIAELTAAGKHVPHWVRQTINER